MPTYSIGAIREGTVLSEELEKTHHVSPLMGMGRTYTFSASEPGERLRAGLKLKGARYHPHPEGAEVAR
jgi:DUF1365 family protein